MDVAEQAIDDARLEMGQVRRSEEGKHRYREIVRDNIRTKFERFRVWAKENMGPLAAIAISIAGIITTVVVAGKKTITGAANGLGAAGKALAKFAKAVLSIPGTYFKYVKYDPKLGSQGSCLPRQKFVDCGNRDCRSYIQVFAKQT